MKITKLIIPLLALTSINDANKQELLQIEKSPEISYEVLMNDNWNNHLVNNIVESSVQNQIIFAQLNTKNEVRKPISCPNIACEQTCWEVMTRCTVLCLGSIFPPACQAACLAFYGICMAACNS